MMLAMVGHNSGKRTRCIFRAHGERGYTKLKNSFLQDSRLSDETRGLVARLLSLPDDWEVTVQSIIASGKAGRDKVYRMIKEAEEFGYIKPEVRRREADGTLGRQIYFVSDDPQALLSREAQELYDMEAAGYPLTEKPEVDEKPCPAEPLPANPDMAKVIGEQQVSPCAAKPDLAKPLPAEPLPANPHAYKKNIEDIYNPPIAPPPEEPSPKRRRGAVPDQYPQDFEAFWAIYPRREGKAKALEVWQRLKIQQKRRAYVALKSQIPALKAKMADRRGNFCPLPATWIGQGRFDDEVQESAVAHVSDKLLDMRNVPLTKPRPADEAPV